MKTQQSNEETTWTLAIGGYLCQMSPYPASIIVTIISTYLCTNPKNIGKRSISKKKTIIALHILFLKNCPFSVYMHSN